MSTYQHDQEHDDGLVHVHVHPASIYYKVFGALVLFTLITVGLSRIHLGEWNFFIAVVIATVKAGLVAAFFMHLKDDSRFNVMLFVGSLLFIGVFFVYTMNDTQHRGQWDNSYGTRVSDQGEPAPGRGRFTPIELPAAEHGEHGAAHH